MDKRVLLTVGLCMLVLIVWTRFFAPSPPATTPTGSSQVPAAASAPSPGTPPGVPPATGTSGQGPAASGAATPSQPAAQTRVIEQKGYYRATFTSWGAAPRDWVLTSPQYKEEVIREGKTALEPINLVRGERLPFTTTFPQSDFSIAPDAAWTLASSSQDEVVFVADAGAAHLEKRYSFVPKSYEIHLRVSVQNRGDKPLAEHLGLNMAGWQDPQVKSGGIFSKRVSQTEGMCDIAGKLKHGSLESLLKSPIDEQGQIAWVGVGSQYFVSAAATQPSPENRRCEVRAAPEGSITALLEFSERRLKPGEQTEYLFVGFLGPKILDALDSAKVGGADAKLGDAVNYGWTEAIARPMLAILKAIHAAVPNWGWAIVALTLLIKAVTWWPNAKSMKSMKAMAKLKPEMDGLKVRYGSDKQRMNVEVMNLYKKHGINPLGGCLPVLIQMPIYIALYAMLGNSVELYRSGFVGWIHDLTAPDPYYVLPLLTGLLMFAQQRLSPAPPDPQQKMMMIMMPIMFTAFSIFLPAGLTVYILTNTVLTMAQQWWFNRHDPPMQPQPARAQPAPKAAMNPAKKSPWG